MKRTLSTGFRLAAMLALWLGSAGQVGAGPLDPLAFAPVGPFPTAAGTYKFDTSSVTLDDPKGVPLLTGVVSNGIAVFDFATITVGSDQVFVGTGTLPLALLSRGDISINGTIDVSAPPVPISSSFFSPGGPGGFGSGSGPGAGGGGADSTFGSWVAPGGGGFGGRGGNGGYLGPPPDGPVVPFGGARGGSSYGDLAIALQGGSGGGTQSGRYDLLAGGGGGGAIEVGAVGRITVRGSILANGASGAALIGAPLGAGGGSGGGIFLYGDSVALLGVLSAQGGSGRGGGGGGGRVLIETGAGGFSGDVNGINVSGGFGAGLDIPFFYPGPFSGAGTPGAFSPVPEPASLLLLAVGMLAVQGLARHVAHRRAG
jgi:hypothetical protein